MHLLDSSATHGITRHFPDMAIPTVFITKIMAILNGLVRGDQYDPEPFDKLKNLVGHIPLGVPPSQR